MNHKEIEISLDFAGEETYYRDILFGYRIF